MVGRSTTCNVAEMVNSERSLHRCRSDGSGLLSVPQNVQRRLRLEASQNAGLEATFAEVTGNQVATIAMTTDEAWRLLTNNLSPERQAALTTSGDSVLIEVLRNTRAIIGSPK
jgi:hypothetical protein